MSEEDYTELVEALAEAFAADDEERAGELKAELAGRLDAADPIHGAVEMLRTDPGSAHLREYLRSKLSEAGLNLLVNTGSGALILGHDNVVAEKVVRADRVRDVFLGNVYHGDDPKSPEEVLAIYRRSVVNDCGKVPLLGLDHGAGDPSSGTEEPDLAQVYVGLDTKSFPEEKEASDKRPDPEDREKKPITALEAVRDHRRVVLTGDPGSGKSTFVNFLCVALALGRGEMIPGWPGDESDLLPVRLILRDFAASLTADSQKSKPTVADLCDFLGGEWKERRLGFAEKPLEEAFEAGKAILLADGLDEIPDPAKRAAVRDALLGFETRFPKCRIVVTCRIRSYHDREAAWRFPDQRYPPFELAPFSPGKIEQFIRSWYGDLKRMSRLKGDPADHANRLWQAVQRPDLLRVAPNPLLLTVMAVLGSREGSELPDARALLYEEIIDLLMYKWDQVRHGRGTGPVGLGKLVGEAGCTRGDVKDILADLAFEAHRKGGTGDETADIGELALRDALLKLHPARDENWVRSMIEAMKHRAGLLIERDEHVFSFPHRTFQEYLAGACLVRHPKGFVTEAARLAAADGGLQLWREAILLAAGKIVHQIREPERVLPLISELCPAKRAGQLKAPERVGFAGEILAEIGEVRAERTKLGGDLLKTMRKTLEALAVHPKLGAVERAEIGRVLGRLGDRRAGVGIAILNGRKVPDLAWSDPIAPGPFPMGNDEPEAEYDWEKPRFDCGLIRESFVIGKYPVTVAQYALFREAGGYRERRFWTEAGWEWRKENRIEGPEDATPVFQTPNHPRIGVCWYEAAAFCRWASETLEREIALPTEAQWERAARHTDARLYPWDDDSPEKHCNMGSTGIGHTSAVGIFPSGKAICGALDLSGNVLEWCRTLWLSNYDHYDEKADDDLEGAGGRVWRGGAFGYGPDLVRCAFRYWLVPDFRNRYIGFRVVSSSILR